MIVSLRSEHILHPLVHTKRTSRGAAQVLPTHNKVCVFVEGCDGGQAHVLDIFADAHKACFLFVFPVKAIELEAAVVAIDGDVVGGLVCAHSERDKVQKLALAGAELDKRAVASEEAALCHVPDQRRLLLQVLLHPTLAKSTLTCGGVIFVKNACTCAPGASVHLCICVRSVCWKEGAVLVTIVTISALGSWPDKDTASAITVLKSLVCTCLLAVREDLFADDRVIEDDVRELRHVLGRDSTNALNDCLQLLFGQL
jgi:hypothetical protein